MSGPVTPILLLTGVSFANNWYNHPTNPDLKILVGGAVAGALASAFGNVPNLAPVVTGIAWVAFVGWMVAQGTAKGTPLGNLLSITGTG